MNIGKLIGILIIVGLMVFGWKFFQHYKQENTGHILTLYGNVDIRDVELSFRVSGRINQMLFEEGDRVTAGTIVATLDKDTFTQDLNTAKAQLAESEAALKNAQQTYDRRLALVKTGAISKDQFDAGVSDRDQNYAKVQSSKTMIEKSKTALADADLHSPSDGRILTRVSEPGAIVQAGQAVYTLALDNPIWVRTYVDEPGLGHVYMGQKATITTDSGRSYIGQVGFISPQAEFTPKTVETTQLRTNLVYRLRVIINQADDGLRQGMPVTVTIDTRQEPSPTKVQ